MWMKPDTVLRKIKLAPPHAYPILYNCTTSLIYMRSTKKPNPKTENRMVVTGHFRVGRL